MSTSTKKGRNVDPERIYDLLLGSRTASECTLHFKDGRILRGALVFNQFKGTGRLINVDREFSLDFHIRDLDEVIY